MSMPERAVRAGAQHTRREILLTAARLFAERGFADVSVIEVAAAAGVFPNQVTYYFGGKDGLFVEVAGRLILEAGQAAEIEAQKAKSVREYTRMLAASVLGPGLPAVLAFIEAMLIARRRADLAPQIKATLDRLHEEGARATSEVMARKRWRMMTTPEIAAQNFWATITGVALQMVASGTTAIGSGIDALALVELNLVDRQSGPENPGRKKSQPQKARPRKSQVPTE
jgi:TetR/AcrR family transcriptional regulator, regulator of cefoperazone and chloramphenicol sensitivity